MKKVNHRNSISRILGIALALMLAFSTSIFAQGEAAIKEGEALFKANCAACHKMDAMSTGPALRGVEARLEEEEGLDREWLYKWIKNSSALIKSGDRYAVKVYEANGKRQMTAFPQLSNEDIDNILAYTAQEKAPPVNGGGELTPVVVDNGGFSNKMILWALIVLFGLLALGLFLVNKTLRKFAVANGTLVVEEEKGTPIWKAFVQNQFLVIVATIFFLLGSAYFGYGYLMQVGVDQGYQPIQPIHYSHRIHAGDNKIECKYCHSSARVSKHSGIPSLNVCMNCHKNIAQVSEDVQKEGVKYGVDYNAEIQKLYEATGWDPTKQDYVNDPKPVKWVRIHNLPDFVYFNHSQHVSVAGVDCQTCHGQIQEMEIVEQHSPLTMGWCINCHRETDVNFRGSAYYDKIHEQLKEKYGVESFKASQMGALECGKCHY
ncbi:cytochrome c3 family protein [Kordia algicida OT-1]|uniref:Cytochrome c, mono-and diheme variant n=1 Tax=Kordia algicida OT-1 TaxID=391587 RepID=A9DPE2_9FLAO|nr:cytochrome c3 family protein [Kordia algicida]EDP97414.1 cytochrome c, mono- and diheme variant [Kordia algicida OT-1]